MALSNRQKSQLFSLILIVVIVCMQFFNRQKTATSFDELNMDISKRLIYTKHANCRMDCRKIDKSEIDYIRKEGKINYYKSSLEDKPCPTIAKEGRTKDGQKVRIVFAECDRETKVVTAIDLENNYDCYCK